MTHEERALSLVTVERSANGNYHDLYLGGLRLHTFFAGAGDESGEKAAAAAQAHRQALARVLAGAFRAAVAQERAAIVAELHHEADGYPARDGWHLALHCAAEMVRERRAVE